MGNAVLACCSQHFRQTAQRGSADNNSQDAPRARGGGPLTLMLMSRGRGLRVRGGALGGAFSPQEGKVAPGGAEGRRGAVLSLWALPPPVSERRLLGGAAPAAGGEGGDDGDEEVRSPAPLASCGWWGALASRWGREGVPRSEGPVLRGSGSWGRPAPPQEGLVGCPGRGRVKGGRW